MKHYETHNMVSSAGNIGITFYLRINVTRMKKTAKTHRDNKAIQRNIDWLRIKTKYFKRRAFGLLKNGRQKEGFALYYFHNRYSAIRYLKKLGIDQQVTKKVSSRFKNRRHQATL